MSVFHGDFVLPGLNLRLRTIYCIGRNYREHAKELNNPVPSEPVIFLKPASAACVTGSELLIPRQSARVDHEVEAVVAIGKKGKFIDEDSARDFVAGYAVGIDFTARDLQDAAKKKALPWAVAKGFDTFAPMGAFIPIEKSSADAAFDISLRVNGELRQQGTSSEMLFSIPALIAYLSRIFTLYPGDVIFTGTPAGVKPVKDGDKITAALNAGSARSELEICVKNA